MRRRASLIRWAIAAAMLLGSREGRARAAEEPTGFSLGNGLKVRLVPLRDEPKAVVLLAVRAGIFDEPAGRPHLAHVAEHLIVFGVPAGSDEGRAVARWFEGGRANGETLPGLMYFDLHVPPEELELALKVQAGRLARPEFTDAILAREVPRALGELEHLEGSEAFGTGKFAHSAFVQAALHGRAEAAIKAATRRLAVEDVRRFHALNFRPDRAILVVLGDFDAPAARKAVEGAFGAIPNPTEAPARPILRVEEKDRTVGWDARTRHLFLAWPTPPAASPEHAALGVAAEVLSTRLAQDRDLADLALMPMATNEVEGLFLIGAQARPGRDLEPLKAKLLGRVGRLSAPEGLGNVEVALARQGLLRQVRPGGLQIMLRSLGGSNVTDRSNRELRRITKEIAWGDVDAYAARVEAVDGAAVRAAIASLLAPDRAVVVRVLPVE